MIAETPFGASAGRHPVLMRQALKENDMNTQATNTTTAATNGAELLGSWVGPDAAGIVRAIRAAAVTRTLDRKRPAIAGVLLTQGAAVATDFYALAVVDADYHGPDVVLGDVIVTAMVKLTAAALKRVTQHSTWSLRITRTLGTVEVTFGGGDGLQVVRAEEPGTFPAFRSLYPEPAAYSVAGVSVALNPMILARMAAVVKALDGDWPCPAVLVHVDSAGSKPTVWMLKVHGVGVTWVQMPVRVTV
jgi:hypothetical protein